MAEHFNAPPGWPVPSGWTPPADWDPDPTWPPAPAGWQFWVSDESGPVPTPTVSEKSSDAVGKRLMILGIAGVVVLIALVGAVLVFLHIRKDVVAQSSSDTASGQQTETWKTLPSTVSTAPSDFPTVLPAGAVECGVSVGGVYRGAARGNDVTSCPFAESVRDALNNAGGQVPTSVDAYSPVTKKHYRMSCAMEWLITCRGGDDAVVYVYKSTAATAAPLTNTLPSDAAIFEALKQSGVSPDDVSRYAIVSKAAPKPGWYVAEIRLIDIALEHGWAIFRDGDPPDGHLVTVAGPGTNFPGVSVPDEVRQALPGGMIP